MWATYFCGYYSYTVSAHVMKFMFAEMMAFEDFKRNALEKDIAKDKIEIIYNRVYKHIAVNVIREEDTLSDMI